MTAALRRAPAAIFSSDAAMSGLFLPHSPADHADSKDQYEYTDGGAGQHIHNMRLFIVHRAERNQHGPL